MQDFLGTFSYYEWLMLALDRGGDDPVAKGIQGGGLVMSRALLKSARQALQIEEVTRP